MMEKKDCLTGKSIEVLMWLETGVPSLRIKPKF